jgi:hypothetical protein
MLSDFAFSKLLGRKPSLKALSLRGTIKRQPMYRSKQLGAVQARFAGSGVERILGARHRPFVGNPNNVRKRSKPNSGSLWHVFVWRWDHTEVL